MVVGVLGGVDRGDDLTGELVSETKIDEDSEFKVKGRFVSAEQELNTSKLWLESEMILQLWLEST